MALEGLEGERSEREIIDRASGTFPGAITYLSKSRFLPVIDVPLSSNVYNFVWKFFQRHPGHQSSRVFNPVISLNHGLIRPAE